MTTPSNFARTAWALLEPIHAVVHCTPEPVQALKDAGYRGYWMGYFAQRSAPLGAVGPDVVHALFYNFGWERVAEALLTGGVGGREAHVLHSLATGTPRETYDASRPARRGRPTTPRGLHR